jgi:hypothetical protein
MDFQYEADTSEGIEIAGCGISRPTIYEVFRFAPGTTVFNCYKASRGVLERLTIKRIDLLKNRRTYNRYVPLYVDTLNSLYNEDELCTETEAVELATFFYTKQLAEIDQLFYSCQFPKRKTHTPDRF